MSRVAYTRRLPRRTRQLLGVLILTLPFLLLLAVAALDVHYKRTVEILPGAVYDIAPAAGTTK